MAKRTTKSAAPGMSFTQALEAMTAYLSDVGDEKQAKAAAKALNAVARAHERETAKLRRQAKG